MELNTAQLIEIKWKLNNQYQVKLNPNPKQLLPKTS